MRKAFVKALTDVMASNDKAVLLIGDIGAYLLRDIKNKYPNRFFNMGIAEANMMSVASAMALDGWIPYVYTITPFVTARCFDQIRVGVGIHNANVKIIGIGSGLTYSHLGSTHHSIEDVSLMRSIPGMTIYSPSDGNSAYQVVKYAAEVIGPVYIRLTRDTKPLDIVNTAKFQSGKAKLICDGRDVTVICTGEIIHEVLEAISMLKKDKISIRLLEVHTIKPLDKTAIKKAFQETRSIVTIEEHSVIGGLGSAVSEILMESGITKTGTNRKTIFKRIGIEDEYVQNYGTREDIFSLLGMDARSIYKKIKKMVSDRRNN